MDPARPAVFFNLENGALAKVETPNLNVAGVINESRYFTGPLFSFKLICDGGKVVFNPELSVLVPMVMELLNVPSKISYISTVFTIYVITFSFRLIMLLFHLWVLKRFHFVQLILHLIYFLQ